LQIRIRTLLRENAECHAQIRLLGAKVFELSEALEAISKGRQTGVTFASQLDLVLSLLPPPRPHLFSATCWSLVYPEPSASREGSAACPPPTIPS